MPNLKDSFTVGLDNAFQPTKLTVYFVDAVAGAGKTHEALRVAAEKARTGGRTLIVMPTLELIFEWEKNARDWYTDVYSESITSADDVPGMVATRLLAKMDSVDTGCILFATHTAAFDLVKEWPESAKQFHLIVDEIPEVLLTHKPFRLPANHWLFRQFVDTVAVPTTIAERRDQSKAPPEFTEFEEKRLESLIKKNDNSASRHSLTAKKAAWERWKNGSAVGMTYYRVLPILAKDQDDPLRYIRLRVDAKDDDDIYEYIDPVPARILRDYVSHDAPMFTAKVPWDKLTDKTVEGSNYRRGTITFIGFRRPDNLKGFKSVTVMSALFKHTMAHDIWKQLGIKFIRSKEVKRSAKVTDLGNRTLRIYYITDERWSKYLRNRVGIVQVFNLIKKSRVIGKDDEVCVVVNKDIADEDNPKRVTDHFPKAIVMPHSSQGQNRFDEYHKMIYLAALNPYTTDIQWIADAFDINSETQHINRTAQAIYQTTNRLSTRDPKSTEDVTVVVPQKFIADWIAKWYKPKRQVIVEELPTEIGNIFDKRYKGRKKGATGKKPAMTAAERMRNKRERDKKQNTPNETK